MANDPEDGSATTRLLRRNAVDDPPDTRPLPGPPPVLPAERLPERIGPYPVVGLLGRGGMGEVYDARDVEIRRPIAVKVLRPEARADAALLRRFVEEARITGQLEHPSIVPVHALGVTDDGTVWFAMRRIQGRTLHQLLREVRRGDRAPGGWNAARRLRAFVQVCQAVAHAHARGVVHRDLKPSNLIFGEVGEVFVVDWGVATAIGQRSVGGAVYGTEGYVAPEQLVAGARPDPRGDVWALGAILRDLVRAVPTEDPPEELLAIVRDAQAPVEERIPSAEALAARVEAFLEGTLRREEAGRLLARAEQRLAAARALEAEAAALEQRRAALEAEIPPWAPLEEKAELHRIRARLADLEIEIVDGFEAVFLACEQALARDPAHESARAFLAERYLERMLAAERAGDRRSVVRWRARVEALDLAPYRRLLDGKGKVALTSDPPGARVVARPYDRRGLVWALGPATPLGTTPLEAVLPMGSWRLELHLPGRDPVVYPVWLDRGAVWTGRVRIPAPGEIPPGFAYVPGGPFVRGGDPEPGQRPRETVDLPSFAIAVLPVTLADYVLFLDDLAPDEAWARCPRLDAGLDGEGGGRLLLPPTDGRGWRLPDDPDLGPDAPVHSVSWEDGRAYAAWRARREGRPYRLPGEDEWEKAARGVDGRLYPWGDEHDPSLSKMSLSRPGTPRIEPVGAFPTDVSVYGVRDMAGSMRCWCADETFDGDPARRPVRGGSYATSARVSRCPARYGSPPQHVLAYQGLRLALELPDRSER